MRLYLSSYRIGNHPAALQRLLNGKQRTAFIANAVDYHQQTERAERVSRGIEELRLIDLDPVEIDLRNYFAQPDALRESLNKFDLLWVRGGNSFILRRAFRKSGADRVIVDLLKNDSLVYGGYSAGIDMLTPTLRGIDLVDDPKLVPSGYDLAVIWDGLGILPYSIAPHYKSDHPESAAIDQSVTYLIDHHLLFIALRDGEVIVRDGEVESVLR